MRDVTCLLAVVSLVPLVTLSAQAPPPVEPGQRVRVTAPELGVRKQAGKFVTLRGDTLVLAADSTMNYPLTSVTGLDVFGGRKSFGAGKGAGLGFLIGAGGGAVIGALFGLSPDAECSFWDSSASGPCPGTLAIVGAILGGVTGTLVGVVSGALVKTDRWEEVPLDRLRVSFAPQRDRRIALGVLVRF